VSCSLGDGDVRSSGLLVVIVVVVVVVVPQAFVVGVAGAGEFVRD
jgi:hypothetical protein